MFDTFNVVLPDAEQPAEVSADERTGVEDEGGAVEAEVDVGGDGHHQGALIAVQVLQKFAQYSRIYQDTNGNDTMINGLLNMRISTGTDAIRFKINTIVLTNARLVAMVLTTKMMMP